MKKHLLRIAITLTVLIFFSACNTEDDITVAEKSTEEFLIPSDDTEETPETLGERTDLKSFEDIEEVLIRNNGTTTDMQKRGYLTLSRPVAHYSNYERYLIYCQFLESINALSYGTKRLDNHNFYKYFGLHTDLQGDDMTYYLEINHRTVVDISLENATENLAMLLFKGDYKYQNGHVIEKYKELLAYSTSQSRSGDRIKPLVLEPGKYLLVVDSRYRKNSNYELYINCYEPNTACSDHVHAYGLKYDDFNQYRYGDITPQSHDWEKWNPHNPNDVQVVKYDDHDYRKAMLVKRLPHVHANQQPDVIYKLGENRSGLHELKFDLGIYKGKSAYFDLIKTLTPNNQHNEIGAKLYFKSNGTGYVLVNNHKLWFNYPNGKWLNVKLEIDFSQEQYKLYINGHLAAHWSIYYNYNKAHGSDQIEAMSFYPVYTNSYYLVDNICYSSIIT